MAVEQLCVVTSDLHNVMASLRYVVGNLGVLRWQIDALVKASATLGGRAHRSKLANGDVTQLQRTPEGKSSATKLLGRRRRSIVLSLGDTVSARRDKGRRTTPNGVIHARDVSVCAQRRRPTIGKKSLKHNGQQNACDRSDATISFFRRYAETLRRTFRCRRRISLAVDTAVNATESEINNAAHNRCVVKPERRFESVVLRRDCDKLSMTAAKPLTHSIALQRLHETTQRNGMLACSGANLVALSNVPKSKNIYEVHRTYIPSNYSGCSTRSKAIVPRTFQSQGE